MQRLDEHNSILFHSEISDFQVQQEERIRTWLIEVAAAEQQPIEAINYIFLTDDALLKINQDYLNHDDYTDVISFPMNTKPIEGDIFISLDRVRDNASSNSISFESELRRVMVHGLLHFLGYKDKTEADQAMMTGKEDEYLAKYSVSL